MRSRVALPLGMLLAFAGLAVAGAIYFRATHLTARAVPSRVEAVLARAARRVAIPGGVRAMTNPVAASDSARDEAMMHFADHCASCHANNGSGDTELGRGFYPPAPDMRLAATQQLTDGELFYIIENGVRFTGMPAWSTGTKAGAESSWRLVQFIRHLPAVSDAELARMEAANPRSPETTRQEIEDEKFLRGEKE
jgi:mono/diheme cytochrome c family protein